MSDGTEWTSSYINLKSLNDVDVGLAEGKILIGKAGGARFEYTDFTLDALRNVNASTKANGYALTWTGTEWKAAKNKIESINELDGFDISGSPSNKFMYHDGTNWVDKSFVFVEAHDRFVGCDHFKRGHGPSRSIQWHPMGQFSH